MLSTLTPQPADALLALIKLYAADPRSDKIDLGVGVYRTDTGATPVFAAIKAAEKKLVENQDSKSYLGPEGERVAEDRKRAYMAQAKKHKLKVVVQSTGHIKDEASGLSAGLLALKDKPDALVCFNDNVAFGAQDALARTKQKVAITGYDNTFFSALERINLTSVDQDKEGIVAKVVELLSNREVFDAFRGSEILIEPNLIVRKSTTKP